MDGQLEMMFELWCSDWHYEIGPDRDGLGCVELRYYEGQETKSNLRMSFPPNDAEKIASALRRVAESMKGPQQVIAKCS